MNVSLFFEEIRDAGVDFFTGVPDSLLQPFTDKLAAEYGAGSFEHIVAHNEGGAVALCAGHYIATGNVGCVYMQNSGIGNAANPAISLTHPLVYGVPVLYVVGWRGEPGKHDEPQHVYQGKMTVQLLKDLDITCFIVDKDTVRDDINAALNEFRELSREGKSYAFVIKKGAFEGEKHVYENEYTLVRERAIELILCKTGDDIIVSTTGKISRELFELREKRGTDHSRDFLTVGSMGHSSMLALRVAQCHPSRRVWCIDGDGALLMHTGALGVIGKCAPKNFVHIVLNNAAHETVGGVPTVIGAVDIPAMAYACSYRHAFTAKDETELAATLDKALDLEGPIMLEIKVALGARPDLGRPTRPAREACCDFMQNLKGETP